MHTESEPFPTYSSTGVLSCYRERPLCHSLFRGQNPWGGVRLSHCTWLMWGPCLLEAVVKETLCLWASTEPVPKMGLGPLCMLDWMSCGCLEPVKTHCRGSIQRWRVNLEKFKGRVSLSVDPHLPSLPVNLSLSFTWCSSFLHPASLLCLRLLHQPSLKYFLFVHILLCCLCVLLSATGQFQVNWLNLNRRITISNSVTRQTLFLTYCNYVGSLPCK